MRAPRRWFERVRAWFRKGGVRPAGTLLLASDEIAAMVELRRLVLQRHEELARHFPDLLQVVDRFGRSGSWTWFPSNPSRDGILASLRTHPDWFETGREPDASLETARVDLVQPGIVTRDGTCVVRARVTIVRPLPADERRRALTKLREY